MMGVAFSQTSLRNVIFFFLVALGPFIFFLFCRPASEVFGDLDFLNQHGSGSSNTGTSTYIICKDNFSEKKLYESNSFGLLL